MWLHAIPTHAKTVVIVIEHIMAINAVAMESFKGERAQVLSKDNIYDVLSTEKSSTRFWTR